MAGPLKRRAELQALSEDHHNALVIALRCRRVGDGTAEATPDELWPHVIEFFDLQIVPHFDVEERLLIPALESLGESEMAQRLLAEHAKLRGFVSVVKITREDLAVLGQLLEQHIRYEERQVFERVQDRLPAATLEAIAAQTAALPSICPTSLRRLGRAAASSD